jgi:hypothetical protein
VTQFLVGERVYLHTDNERLNGELAVVEAVEAWGCHVVSVAPTWRGSTSNRYRAGWDEMILAQETVTVPPARAADARPRQGGFTGDSCGNCGSFAVVRTGTCATCQDCGHSVGGCV